MILNCPNPKCGLPLQETTRFSRYYRCKDCGCEFTLEKEPIMGDDEE